MSSIGGFHYKGKDKRGVSQWTGGGDWQRLLQVLGVGFTVYGVCAACVFLGLLLYALVTLSWPSVVGTFALMSGIHALTFGGSGVWMRRMARHIRSLDTADALSARYGMKEATLAAVAQDKGIKPRMSINGVDYYNQADFEDASILLRGTTRPEETQDVLLRPATADTNIATEQLLRVPDVTSELTQVVTGTRIQTSSEATVQEIRRQ